MPRSTCQPKHVMLRLSEPLRDELAHAAAEDCRPLADFIRRLLLDFAAKRMARRERERIAA
jgi:hypothetical protein